MMTAWLLGNMFAVTCRLVRQVTRPWAVCLLNLSVCSCLFVVVLLIVESLCRKVFRVWFNLMGWLRSLLC